MSWCKDDEIGRSFPVANTRVLTSHPPDLIRGALVIALFLTAACRDTSLSLTGLQHTQEIEFVSPAEEEFVAMAADESTLVVGLDLLGHHETSFDFDTGEEWREIGGVAVFEQRGGHWDETAFLTHATRRPARFGERLAVDGETIFASLEGYESDVASIVVYEKMDGAWSRVEIFEDLGCILDIAIEAGTAVVAACSAVVHVFQRDATGWNKIQELPVPANVSAIALAGPTLVAIGSTTTINGSDIGHSGFVSVFERNGDLFVETQVIEPETREDFGRFGSSVDVSGDRIALGAERENGVYIYDRKENSWVQTARLEPANLSDVGSFGWDVALDGSRLLVGAPNEWNGGVAYIFEEADGQWEQRYLLKTAKPHYADFFGAVVALTHNRIIVGGFGWSNPNPGHIHIWTLAEAP